MNATLFSQAVTVSHRLRNPAWPAVLAVLTLACVTPPSQADASEPSARASEQNPPAAPAPMKEAPATPAPATATPAAPVADTPEPATPAPTAPATSPGTAPAPARAEVLCDTNWFDGQSVIIQIGERKDDGKPLQSFKPNEPMYPYELPGGRFLYGEKGMVFTAVGRFESHEAGEAALKKVETERPSARAFLTRMGAYLVPESRTCKVTQLARGKTPAIGAASWLVETEGVLLAGVRTQCKNGQLAKKVSFLSCDGMKTLLTDSVSAPCEAGRVNTCMHTLAPGVVLLAHEYSAPGGTQMLLRGYDVKKKQRLYSGDFGNEGGPDAEITRLEDVDGDGVPEIVTTVAGTGKRTSVLKWNKGRFAESKSP